MVAWELPLKALGTILMDTFWQSLLSGLIVAAVTGLTIIAYRNPTAYRRMYPPLRYTLYAVLAAWFFYNIGLTTGYAEATIDVMKLNSPQIVKMPPMKTIPGLAYFGACAVLIYLELLQLLPFILSTERQRHDEGDGQ